MRKELSARFGVLFMAVLVSSCAPGTSTANKSVIFPKGVRGPTQIFTKTVWVQHLHRDRDKAFDTQVYNVTFEPSARTHWHSHPGGQILLCTHGTGYYQEQGKPARLLTPGSVVAISPNVIHWHGAAPGFEFVHVGMSTRVHLGPAQWYGPVTDEQYRAATAK